MVPLGVEIIPRFNRGKIKKLSKRKTSKYNGKCLTTHYQRYKEEFHNEK